MGQIVEQDKSQSEDSKPPRRFYLQRYKDQTGVSRTGRVLEGAVFQDGRVVTQWRPPLTSMGIYNSLAEFKAIHIDCHPSCSDIVWLDKQE